MKPLTLEDIENHPRWQPRDEMQNVTNLDTVQLHQRGGDGVKHALAVQEWVLAVDPQGNLCQMVVRPNPVNPYDPRKKDRGADRSSFKSDTIRRKADSGWIMVDLQNVPDRIMVDEDGRRRAPSESERRAHWEKILPEINKRRMKNEADDKRNADARKTEMEKSLEVAQATQRKMTEFVEAVGAVSKRGKKAADE